jgi:hypothetical protein
METSVNRPAAPDKKIRTSEDFELAYMRHQYFRRVKYNPTQAEMYPYMYIVSNLSKNTFFTYFNLFKAVGMYQDDVLNIGRVHLVSFLGLYALEKNKKKKAEFAEVFERKWYKEPEQKDFDQKNKANFTFFFKQRMEDLVRVCRQKVRNIKGQSSEEYQVFSSKNEPPKNGDVKILLRNYEELGYKKVDFAIFKSIRKKAGVNHDATIFKFENTWYVAIALEQKNLELEDIVGSILNPYENEHNMQPDDIYMEKESNDLSKLFNKRSAYRKKVTLRNFIAKYQFKRQYKEEIATAKKLLKSLGD